MLKGVWNMNKSILVEKLYDDIQRQGLINTIASVFGRNAKIEMGYTKKVCDTDVAYLNLSVRSYNALMRAGCKTIGDAITAINNSALHGLRNLGVKSVAEIRSIILEYGYEQLSERRKKEFLHNLVEINGK